MSGVPAFHKAELEFSYQNSKKLPWGHPHWAEGQAVYKMSTSLNEWVCLSWWWCPNTSKLRTICAAVICSKTSYWTQKSEKGVFWWGYIRATLIYKMFTRWALPWMSACLSWWCPNTSKWRANFGVSCSKLHILNTKSKKCVFWSWSVVTLGLLVLP